jgi:hypothetical protein
VLFAFKRYLAIDKKAQLGGGLQKGRPGGTWVRRAISPCFRSKLSACRSFGWLSLAIRFLCF